jgi:hypothetical protein
MAKNYQRWVELVNSRLDPSYAYSYAYLQFRG